jgi:hypothetical protein
MIILGEADFAWEFSKPVPVALEVKGLIITAFLDGKAVCSAIDADAPFPLKVLGATWRYNT